MASNWTKHCSGLLRLHRFVHRTRSKPKHRRKTVDSCCRGRDVSLHFHGSSGEYILNCLLSILCETLNFVRIIEFPDG